MVIVVETKNKLMSRYLVLTWWGAAPLLSLEPVDVQYGCSVKDLREKWRRYCFI